MAKNKKIYTSIPNYVQLKQGFSVCNYSKIPIYRWAKKRIEEMSYQESSPAEEKFMSLCKSFQFSLFRQVFFQIDEKAYFLDFFLPTKNIAIEIDGRYHQSEEQALYDKKRDEAFLSIGIRTIRFTTDELNDKDFYDKYYSPRLSGIGYNIRPKHTISKHEIRLKRAVSFLQCSKRDDTLEFQSNSMPFLQAISKDHPKRNAADFSLLVRFYEIKKSKNILVLPRFIGNRDNLRKGDLSWVKRLDAKCDKHKNKLVCVI